MTIDELIAKLNEATSSSFFNYSQVKKIENCGLYLIYQDNQIIYVGKTDRNGKVRLRELAADYRSHTLNRKLLHSVLNNHLKQELPPLNKESKHRLISGGLILESDFLNLQAQINYQIRNHLKFQFYHIEGKDLLRLEHFAIAVLNPKMND
jgi:hypothetical protein